MYYLDGDNDTSPAPPSFSGVLPLATSAQHLNMSPWFVINKKETLGIVGVPDVPLAASTQHRDMSSWCIINKKTIGVFCVLAIVIIVVCATTTGNSNSMTSASTTTSSEVKELYGLPDDCVDDWADECYVNGGCKIRCTCGDGTIWM
jgi:hypothetical protein